MNGGVRVYAAVQLQNLKNARRAMGDAVLSRSRITAPEDTHQMVRSATVKEQGDSVVVEYGASGTEYAGVQEGKQFRHYTKAGSGPHFLENAGDSVAKQGIKPFLH